MVDLFTLFTKSAKNSLVCRRDRQIDHALIGNRYKFLSYLDETRSGEDMLFDIAIDPGERRNLVEARPEVARSMKETLKAWDESCARSDRGEDYQSG